MALYRDIGSHIKILAGYAPRDQVAGTVNGTAIDRRGLGGDGYMSMVLHQACGAASGTPTTQSVLSHIETSVDGSTGWTNLVDTEGTQIGLSAALTADNTENETSVDLSNAERHIRIVTVVSFTGGTAPAVEIQAAAAMGGALKKPAV